MLLNALVLVLLLGLILLVHRLGWWLLRTLLDHGRRAVSRLPRGPLQRLDRALGRRWPRLWQALWRRLDWRHFSGLPLTLLVVLGAWLFALLAGLVEELLSERELQHFDDRVNAWLQPLRGSPLLEIFVWFTELGAAPAMTGLAVTGAVCFWVYRRYWLIPGMLLTIAGSQVTTWLGKYLFARPRPVFTTEITAVSPSFPSGHATSAVAVLGFLAYALTREPLPLRVRYELAYWAAVLSLLIGASRVFLGVHYASDVAAGFLVGGFWLLAGIVLVEWGHHRRRFSPSASVSRSSGSDPAG
ncbi:MAG: phosphatase PAP2 family protein [Candidatus Competibacterales bacterium]|nr:phosphatase PAP2 family protein [Candidatus Competibacterales bacterium]